MCAVPRLRGAVHVDIVRVGTLRLDAALMAPTKRSFGQVKQRVLTIAVEIVGSAAMGLAWNVTSLNVSAWERGGH